MAHTKTTRHPIGGARHALHDAWLLMPRAGETGAYFAGFGLLRRHRLDVAVDVR